MLDWVREQLYTAPEVKTPYGKRRITYADHVASGQPLRWVEEQISHRVLPYYANTHTTDSATGALMEHYSRQARDYIKRCLGAGDDMKLLFCGSGSTAAIKRIQEILGIAVPEPLRQRLLEMTSDRERPVVFVGPYEHHSNELSWRETLAEVVVVPKTPEGLLDLEALSRAVADPRFASRLKIGSFSAASNVTGLLTDTHQVARIIHKAGGVAFFDFAASAPYVAVDMRCGQEDGYDGLFLSAHKLLGGPGSPGILVFDPALYHLKVPTTAGGGTVRYVSEQAHYFIDDIEVREDAGTPPIIQKMRAALAFSVKERVGTEEIERREAVLVRRAIERWSAHPRLELLGNLKVPRLAIVSFLVKESGGKYLHPRLVVRLLNDLFGIQSRGGCSCAGPYGHALLNVGRERSLRYFEAVQNGFEGVKPGWTRMNFNYFITEAQFLFLLEAVAFIADFGERFVPHYKLDWATGAWSHPDDGPLPSLFDGAPEAAPQDDIPYRAYLDEARALAEKLPLPKGRPSPAGLDPDLVYFLL